jgi:putative FmdB family regulatory protein
MPMYHYKCPKHGVFEELQMADKAALPIECPQCSTMSPRVIAISPAILGMDPAKRKAIAKNEKNQHEPLISSLSHREHKHDHGPDCGCCSSKPKKSKTVYLSDGSKTFPADRPWMISH